MAKMIGNIIKRLNLFSTLTALEHNIMLNLTILLLYGPRVDYKTPHLSVHGLAPKGSCESHCQCPLPSEDL